MSCHNQISNLSIDHAPCFIDIANLTHESYQKDITQVLDRALAQGIKKIIITGACPHSNQEAINITQQFQNHQVKLYSTVGIHPHEAKKFSQYVAKEILALTKIHTIKAIGETGLDFYRDLSPRNIQEHAFIEQLAIAAQTKLPVFLHEREAHERFFAIVKDYRDQLNKLIVHCFTGDKKALFRYLDMDCFIGITGWIADERRGLPLLPLIKHIPANRLVIETDAPYLLPRTIQPKPINRRNEPMFLPEIFLKVKQYRHEDFTQLMHQLYQNANNFFNLADL